MKPFLRQVAEHYYSAGNINNRCFVFPNRRSMAFFRKHLSEAVASDPFARPLMAPQMLTINDLFYKVSGAAVTDKVRLLLYLYESYSKLNPKAEPLDEFIFWGDVILSDFNDVDKYLADPSQLFANVSDYKAIQDSFSYLTENQRKAIEGFISHFSDISGKLTVNLDTDNPDVKGRFLLIWNILYNLYKDFNASLNEKGLAYEGMVYRDVATRLKQSSAPEVFEGVLPQDSVLVFIGLNTLNECEKTLLRKLRDAHMAEFCWDYSGDMIKDPQNRSSLFMRDNVIEFPQVADWDAEGLPVPEINVVSVSSSIGQAKRLPDILASVPVADECAVVLPDEGLLAPVLNSIPSSVQDINVTMGLPMRGSLLYVMMETVASIQMHMAFRRGSWHFYHKQVRDLFSNEFFRSAVDEKSAEIISKVKADAKYYIPQEDLCGTPLLDMVFRPVVRDPKSRDREQIRSFAAYQQEVVSVVASAVSADAELALELEYAKEYYKCINMLLDSLGSVGSGLEILPLTYIRLLSQLLSMLSVPFRGEPLKGLQIMGPLETRALDFTHLVIMSANEGVFPRRNVSSSFVPPELRKGFGLPTYELQDAIWAYYFYRMISRAEKVWMMVDSRTEGLKSGEESRYIKQLEYHFGVPLNRYVVKFDGMMASDVQEIVKTEADVSKIRETVLSATAVQNYLACPAKFYYAVVKGLQKEEEVAESLDYGMFGNVFHEVMRSIYTSESAMAVDFFFDRKGEAERSLTDVQTRITKEYIKSWLKREGDIKAKVKALIINEMNAVDVSGRNIVVTDVIVRYVMKTLQRDLELLDEAGRDYFEIIGRELNVRGEFHGFRFKGFIDRLDSFADGEVRVVDYKTGKVLDEDIDIDDLSAEIIADKIFAEDVKDRPKIAFQFYIYDLLLSGRKEVEGKRLSNCVYSTSRLFADTPKVVPVNAKFYDAVSTHLEELLDEMTDMEKGFRRTEDSSVCGYCDFRNICGR